MDSIEITEQYGDPNKYTGIIKIGYIMVRVDIEWKDRTMAEIKSIAEEMGIDFSREYTVRTVMVIAKQRETWVERYEQPTSSK